MAIGISYRIEGLDGGGCRARLAASLPPEGGLTADDATRLCVEDNGLSGPDWLSLRR